jgi:hypothetical protein
LTETELRLLITARDDARHTLSRAAQQIEQLGVSSKKAAEMALAAQAQGGENKMILAAERSLKRLGLTAQEAQAMLRETGKLPPLVPEPTDIEKAQTALAKLGATQETALRIAQQAQMKGARALDYQEAESALRKLGVSGREAQTMLEKAGLATLSAGDKARQAARDWEQFGGSLQRAGGALTGLTTKLAVGVGVPLLAAGAAAVKLGSDVVESENLFDVSMGKMAAEARAWSQGLRNSLGVNAVEVRRNLGTWQDMLENMQLGEEQAFAMSKGLTQLAYDFASFRNIRPEEAFEKLQSAMAGESEPMRRFGVDVSDAAVQQYALRNGIIAAGQELSNQQKLLIRYNLLLAQTTSAQGDLARTADQTANQFRRLESGMTELGQQAGQMLLPTVNEALQALNNDALPRLSVALQTVNRSWGEMGESGRAELAGIATLLVAGGPLLSGLGKAIELVGKLRAGMIGLQVSTAGWVGLVVAGVAALDIAASKLAKPDPTAIENMRKTAEEYRESARKFREAGDESRAQAWEQMAGNIEADAKRREQQISGTEVLLRKLGELEGQAFKALLAGIDESIGQGQVNAALSVARSADIVAEGYRDVGASAREVVQVYSQVGNEAIRSAQQQQQAAQMAASAARFAASLAAAHPAAQRAAADVQAWEDRIRSVNLAIQANSDQQQAAQAEYSRMQERLADINDELSKHKQHLDDLRNIRLPGMNAMDEQGRAIDAQVKRLRLQQLALFDQAGATNRKGDLRGQAKKQYEELERQIDVLERRGQQLDLTKSLKYDEQLRKLREAAEGGPQKEVPYEQALKDIQETLANIAKLEKDRADQEQVLKDQQKAMEGIKQAGDGLNRTLQTYQDHLATAKRRQDDVNDALKTYYDWLLKDREEMRKLGGAAEAEANRLDREARSLLKSFSDYAAGIDVDVGKSLDKFKAMVDAAVAARAEADLPSGQGSEFPNRTSYGGYAPTRRAMGGPVYPEGHYIVGERGIELLTVGRAGRVDPLRPAPARGGGGVYIDLRGMVVHKEADEDRLVDKIADRLDARWTGEWDRVEGQQVRGR